MSNPSLPVPITMGLNAVLTSAIWASQVTNLINWILNPPMATLRRSATAQTFATSGTAAAVSWDTVTTDGYNGYSSSNPTRWTCPTGYGGTYLIIGSVAWTANATGNREVMIYRNGAAVSYTGQEITAAAAATTITATQVQGLVTLAPGDYIEIWAMQSSGGSLTTSTTGTSLQMLWMRS